MHLIKLFEMQKDLDSLTLKNHPIETSSLPLRKILGLQVSIGNLASKSNCCDLWKSSKTYEKSKLMDDYIVALNHLLSIGNDKGYNDIEITVGNSAHNITDHFITLYIDINDLLLYGGRDHYSTLMEDFLSLGKAFGFTLEEVINSFNEAMLSLKDGFPLAN